MQCFTYINVSLCVISEPGPKICPMSKGSSLAKLWHMHFIVLDAEFKIRLATVLIKVCNEPELRKSYKSSTDIRFYGNAISICATYAFLMILLCCPDMIKVSYLRCSA